MNKLKLDIHNKEYKQVPGSNILFHIVKRGGTTGKSLPKNLHVGDLVVHGKIMFGEICLDKDSLEKLLKLQNA